MGLLERLFNRFLLGIKFQLNINESDFKLDSIDELHYKCQRISLNCSGSYIDSPERIKIKWQK